MQLSWRVRRARAASAPHGCCSSCALVVQAGYFAYEVHDFVEPAPRDRDHAQRLHVDLLHPARRRSRARLRRPAARTSGCSRSSRAASPSTAPNATPGDRVVLALRQRPDGRRPAGPALGEDLMNVKTLGILQWVGLLLGAGVWLVAALRRLQRRGGRLQRRKQPLGHLEPGLAGRADGLRACARARRRGRGDRGVPPDARRRLRRRAARGGHALPRRAPVLPDPFLRDRRDARERRSSRSSSSSTAPPPSSTRRAGSRDGHVPPPPSRAAGSRSWRAVPAPRRRRSLWSRRAATSTAATASAATAPTGTASRSRRPPARGRCGSRAS